MTLAAKTCELDDYEIHRVPENECELAFGRSAFDIYVEFRPNIFHFYFRGAHSRRVWVVTRGLGRDLFFGDHSLCGGDDLGRCSY